MLCLSKNEHRRDGGSREGRGVGVRVGGKAIRCLFGGCCHFCTARSRHKWAVINIWHYCFVKVGRFQGFFVKFACSFGVFRGSVPTSVQVCLSVDSELSVGVLVCAVVCL